MFDLSYRTNDDGTHQVRRYAQITEYELNFNSLELLKQQTADWQDVELYIDCDYDGEGDLVVSGWTNATPDEEQSIARELQKELEQSAQHQKRAEQLRKAGIRVSRYTG